MPLVDLNIPIDATAPPGNVRAFLREARRRIERFQTSARVPVPAFVPSDFESVYAALRALDEAGAAPDDRMFCEWGSGFGVVTCLAALLEFDACGIEVEGELVDAARDLAEDFELPVQFVRGSFVPDGDELVDEDLDGFSWLTTTADGAHQELGLAPDDFAVIFAYPWPDEERVIGELFERHGRAGAVLVTHHSCGAVRLRRKTAPRPRRR
jgi:hypothetical protein